MLRYWSQAEASLLCLLICTEDESSAQLLRTKSDAGVLRRGQRRSPSDQRKIRRHRFSINGHFYNHKVKRATENNSEWKPLNVLTKGVRYKKKLFSFKFSFEFECMTLEYKLLCFVFTLRPQCSRLLSARWPMSASTAAWRHLRCCEFSSTSLKSKTARMTLQSTSCMQVAVSAAHSIHFFSMADLPPPLFFQITWCLLWWPDFFPQSVSNWSAVITLWCWEWYRVHASRSAKSSSWKRIWERKSLMM